MGSATLVLGSAILAAIAGYTSFAGFVSGDRASFVYLRCCLCVRAERTRQRICFEKVLASARLWGPSCAVAQQVLASALASAPWATMC